MTHGFQGLGTKAIDPEMVDVAKGRGQGGPGKVVAFSRFPGVGHLHPIGVMEFPRVGLPLHEGRYIKGFPGMEGDEGPDVLGPQEGPIPLDIEDKIHPSIFKKGFVTQVDAITSRLRLLIHTQNFSPKIPHGRLDSGIVGNDIHIVQGPLATAKVVPEVVDNGLSPKGSQGFSRKTGRMVAGRDQNEKFTRLHTVIYRVKNPYGKGLTQTNPREKNLTVFLCPPCQSMV